MPLSGRTGAAKRTASPHRVQQQDRSAASWTRNYLIDVVGQLAQPNGRRVMRPVEARRDCRYFHCVANDQSGDNRRPCLNLRRFQCLPFSDSLSCARDYSVNTPVASRRRHPVLTERMSTDASPSSSSMRFNASPLSDAATRAIASSPTRWTCGRRRSRAAISSCSSYTIRARSVTGSITTLVVGSVTGATVRTCASVVEQESRSRRNRDSASSS